MTTRVFESTVEYNEDFDEYYITFPEDLLDHTGWEEGDVLKWTLHKDGSVALELSDDYGEDENE
jgi:bifunctional DNA-binding transcriptional regulator/antitoxin component of YhaV-PrlF toxin-antitoxin module